MVAGGVPAAGWRLVAGSWLPAGRWDLAASGWRHIRTAWAAQRPDSPVLVRREQLNRRFKRGVRCAVKLDSC